MVSPESLPERERSVLFLHAGVQYGVFVRRIEIPLAVSVDDRDEDTQVRGYGL